ncbi:hypothetical protein Hanom_Chr03g00199141 [Helianthus anomalus]
MHRGEADLIDFMASKIHFSFLSTAKVSYKKAYINYSQFVFGSLFYEVENNYVAIY